MQRRRQHQGRGQWRGGVPVARSGRSSQCLLHICAREMREEVRVELRPALRPQLIQAALLKLWLLVKCDTGQRLVHGGAARAATAIHRLGQKAVGLVGRAQPVRWVPYTLAHLPAPFRNTLTQP